MMRLAATGADQQVATSLPLIRVGRISPAKYPTPPPPSSFSTRKLRHGKGLDSPQWGVSLEHAAVDSMMRGY
jgi:hypothetical protein